MTFEAYKYYRRGFTVYANYKLHFPYVRLDKKQFDKMVKNKEELRNAVLCIDEAHMWLDSRNSMRQKNIGISYFILQTRKRNVRLLCTTQHLHQVEKRLRDTVDILTFCRNLSIQTATVVKGVDVYIEQQSVYQWKDDMKPRVNILYANPVFKLFDTEEIIDLSE